MGSSGDSLSLELGLGRRSWTIPIPDGWTRGCGMRYAQWILSLNSKVERLSSRRLRLASSQSNLQLTGFASAFAQSCSKWRDLFDSSEPHLYPLPGGTWQMELNSFQKLCVLRCVRPDKTMDAMQKF